MPLLRSRPRLGRNSYKDFAPTELVIGFVESAVRFTLVNSLLGSSGVRAFGLASEVALQAFRPWSAPYPRKSAARGAVGLA